MSRTTEGTLWPRRTLAIACRAYRLNKGIFIGRLGGSTFDYVAGPLWKRPRSEAFCLVPPSWEVLSAADRQERMERGIFDFKARVQDWRISGVADLIAYAERIHFVPDYLFIGGMQDGWSESALRGIMPMLNANIRVVLSDKICDVAQALKVVERVLGTNFRRHELCGVHILELT